MSDRVRWLLLGCAAVVLVVHSLVYNFVTDDAYISFVYSRNFAEHGELTFNLGDHVEGYTNFSWTLVLGLLMVIGVPPEIASRVLGTACALGTLYLTFRIVERALGKKSPWAVVPPLLLACSSGFACWTSGGLETQLFVLLVTASIHALVGEPRGLRRIGIWLALASMTRPEGPLVALVLGAARYIQLASERRWLPTRDDVFAIVWFVAIWAPWFAWRYWYYGYPFPNTYYVKATGPWVPETLAADMWREGAYYIGSWLVQTRLLYMLPFAALGFIARPRTPRFVLGVALGLLALVYVPYAISVGGDFMGLHRFIMPLFVVAALAVTLGLERCASWLGDPRLRRVVAVVIAVAVAIFIAALDQPWYLRAGLVVVDLAALLGLDVIASDLDDRSRRIATVALVGATLAGFAIAQAVLTAESVQWRNWTAYRGIVDTPSFLMVYTEDRAAIGRAMEGCFRDDDFSVVGGAGAQPYYGRMRGVDVFGLVSEKIAHEVPRTRARSGHTKFARETVVESFDPTFIFSCYALHPTPTPAGWNCAPSYWHGKGYETVTMHIPELAQLGTYYSFLAKKSRAFDCPGRVR